MKTRWLPLQVQSSYTMISLNASFLKGMFHHNFTPEHNNSLLSIIGYTLSIQCRLSSLPLTTLLLAFAELKYPVETRSQVPHLKSHSTGSLFRHTGNRQHCSDTNWSWRWQQATSSVTLSLGFRSPQRWRVDQNIIPMDSALQPHESSWH